VYYVFFIPLNINNLSYTYKPILIASTFHVPYITYYISDYLCFRLPRYIKLNSSNPNNKSILDDI
jgi:hypothetical protein